MNATPGGYPVIIIGMHRSGTSMLCRLLGDLGVFFGQDKTRVNYESSFFVQLNRWLFEQCGAAWDRPDAVRELFACEPLYEACREYVARVLKSTHSARYLGKKNRDGIFSIAIPWGWKDPRNTFTLPLWLDLFPDARVINVARNGIDVANSLKVREEAYLKKKAGAVAKGKLLKRNGLFMANYDYRQMTRLSMSLRSLSLEGGLSLWESYMAEARSHVDHLGTRALEVCYEDLLADPVTHMETISAFCGVRPEKEAIAAAVSCVKQTRANAYQGDTVLSAFAEASQERLARYGY